MVETVAHGGFGFLWKRPPCSRVRPRALSFVVAPVFSLRFGAPLARCCLPFYPFVAFGAPCSARLVNCPDPPCAAIYIRPKGRAPPLFCISRTPDTQHLVGGGWHTSRLWGYVLGRAKRAPNLAVLRRRSAPRLGVVFGGRTYPHSRAAYPPPSLRAAATLRGAVPHDGHVLLRHPQTEIVYIRFWGAVKGEINCAHDYRFFIVD